MSSSNTPTTGASPEECLLTNNVGDSAESAKDNEQVKKVKGGKAKEDKIKTEPANPFGQYLKEMKNEGKTCFEENRRRWEAMTEEEKEPYVKMYEEEKDELVAKGNYRIGRKRKVHENASSEPKQGRKGPKKNDVEVESSNLELLTRVQSLDIKIDQLDSQARGLQGHLCDEKVQLALMKFKLNEKTNEIISLKEKHKNLLSQHSTCRIFQ
eukprot:GFUD01138633.1.p1 GENE.GFUD01138633.1~~GFUD01138633.1.p1  ORF type:complete len:223 (-),score=69.19 GFUD01138633.1:58-690(-)